MKETTKKIFDELLLRHPSLTSCKNEILSAYSLMEQTYIGGGKILICGNGGSASDSEHIVGELMKCFKKKRAIPSSLYDALALCGEEGKTLKDRLEGSLPAIALTSHLALTTAFSNDVDPALAFAQQLHGLGKAGDLLVCLSTSGSSKNCVYAAVVAKAKGINTVAMTGEKDGKLASICTVTIKAPATETYLVQEYHLPIYHALCAMLEEEFF